MDIEIKVTVMSGAFVGMGGKLKVSLEDSLSAIDQVDKVNSAISSYGAWVKTSRKDIYPNPDSVLQILHTIDNNKFDGPKFDDPKSNTCEQTSLF